MFDQLFKRASTRAHHVTAPFAEERARYLDYCEFRGDSRSLQLRKAHDLLWIARKLNSHSDLQVTIDQIRALVFNCQHYGNTGGPNLDLLSTRKRLLGQFVHVSGFSAISANQVCRFRSDHGCLNTATGRSSSGASATTAFIFFAEQSGNFFVGMVQPDGSSPASMPAI